MITNHGGQFVGRGRREYYLVGEKYDETNADEAALTRFAQALPRGIRVKLVSGACYGGDTQDTLLTALGDRECACGAAFAEPGMQSFDMGPTGGEKAPPGWEGRIFSQLAESSSLVEASWKAWAAGPHSEVGRQPMNLPTYDKSRYARNWAGLSSERLLIKTLSSDLSVQKFFSGQSIDRPTAGDFQAWASKISALFTGSKTPLSTSDRDYLKSSRALAERIEAQLQKNSLPVKEEQQLEQDFVSVNRSLYSLEGEYERLGGQLEERKKESDRKRHAGEAYDINAWITEQTKVAIQQDEVLRALTMNERKYNKLRSSLGASALANLHLVARHELENAFFASAPDEVKARYRELRACELQNLAVVRTSLPEPSPPESQEWQESEPTQH